jgi:hypothetical protein
MCKTAYRTDWLSALKNKFGGTHKEAHFLHFYVPLWQFFRREMKKFTGYNLLEALDIDLKKLEQEIRNLSAIPVNHEIPWFNSKNTDRTEFTRYITQNSAVRFVRISIA